MAANPHDSNSQLLRDLDALTHSLYQQTDASRRTNSLVLSRSTVPEVPTPAPDANRPRSRRLSMTSPFRSRPKSNQNPAAAVAGGNNNTPPSGNQLAGPTEKKGIWNWKPMRVLTHIGMHRLGCLFSVEAVAAQGLPHSMNGLRLAVAVRKKETKEGAVRTMPSRVLQGSADFEETLFLRCHLYCSGGPGTGKPLKFEPRPFLVTVVAIDAPELDFGSSAVDLSSLVKESMERSSEGERVRQWDATFSLSGKARGGELVLKLGFQIMEDGGAGIIYDKADGVRSNKKGRDSSSPSPFARKQSKSSFSVTSPRVSRLEPSLATSKESSLVDLKGLDDFNLDEPGPPTSTSPSVHRSEEPEAKDDNDQDLPEFEIVDKGVEIQTGGEGKEKAEAESEHAAAPDAADSSSSVSSEVVKEVVSDGTHLFRLTELDAIAKQIKALESMMTGDEDGSDPTKAAQLEEGSQKLDANEETVTREFLQMLELEGDDEFKFDPVDHDYPIGAEETADSEQKCFLSDLGKGLGPVVRTRDGGYLAATNPFDVEVQRKDTPKLAMQISRPILLHDRKPASGFEVFQKLAAAGSDELSSKLLSLASMDELTGKTAEQIAFEGIASAIITGRSKEGASSSAAKSIAILKAMAASTSDGRKDRILTGIWNAGEEPVAPEEILSASLQRMEAMAVEALKIQAGVAEEEAPFDAAPLADPDRVLDSAVVASDDWPESIVDGEATVTMLLVVQLRDPLRRYEAVGGPTIAVVQAARVDGDEEGRFKVTALHVGGLKLRPAAGRRNGLDGEKERLTAMQWLVAYGLAKAGKRVRPSQAKGVTPDLLWSSSSRVVADIWLKAMRNPDIKVPQKKL